MSQPFDAQYVAIWVQLIKHRVSDRIKPSLRVRVPGCQKLQMTA